MLTPLEQLVHSAALRSTRSALAGSLDRRTPDSAGLNGITGGLVYVLAGKGQSLFRAVNFTASFVQANGQLARLLRAKLFEEKR